MLLSYALIIIIVTVLISVLAIQKTDAALKSKVSSMSSTLNVQMKMNINNYLERMETTGTLVFTEKSIYSYNAADESNDEYEALKTESEISDKLYSICIMENYVDFAIVYSNNHTVGKISNGTVELFGESIYEDLSDMITRHRTDDGWYTGYGGNYKRIYYVKRVNDNAVLVTSFYTTELEDVFDHPGGIEDMSVRLLNQDYRIIYSSDDEETGDPLSDEIYSRISGQSSATLMDDNYLVTVNDCGDNWYVVSSVPTDLILAEKNAITLYIIIICLAAMAAALFIGSFILNKITREIGNIVSNLDSQAHTDLLTGVLNKRSFEELAEAEISSPDICKTGALILLDVDNFKAVNDTCGHACGDEVLVGIGKSLRKVFGEKDLLGRLGGDEFAVFMNIPPFYRNNILQYVETKCGALCREFDDNYVGENKSHKISISVGAAVFPDNGTTFSKLYRCADNALYTSKNNGKDTYTVTGSPRPESEMKK
jgi:diguanylate cyclase (GGDEF)-like protein